MSKIVKISLTNFKAISELEMDFKGMSCIVTGANNSGKSSFLKGVVDRIRFIRPDVPVKLGEKEGRGELVLDSGEKFVWEFSTEGKDKLTYITDQGRQSVTKDLGSQFFPEIFDIDKFLQSSPKQQVKQLQKLVGLDFEDLEKRYTEAYNIRTERNREAEIYHVKLEKMMKVDAVKAVDVTKLLAKKEQLKNELNALYLANREANQKKRAAWEEEKHRINNECFKHNVLQEERKNAHGDCFDALTVLIRNGYKGSEAEKFVNDLRLSIQPDMVSSDLYPKEPTYIDEMPDRTELDKVDEQLLKASEVNAQAQKYQDYQDYKMETEAARDAADLAHGVVVNIEAERNRMIESAKFPEGITIGPEGILVDNFPLDKNQISTSKLYCAALRIAAMNIGEVKSLYFDCTMLDNNTLKEISTWAEGENLQLLMEMVSREGKEISYEILEN